MTTLIDIHAPQYDVSESLVVHVDARPAEVLAVVDRLDVARHPVAGVEAVGHGRDERLFTCAWHTAAGDADRVDVVWDIRVEPDDGDGCFVSSTRRFIPSSDGARRGLRAQWRQVRSTADTVARRALRTVKRVAEEEQTVAAGRAPVPMLRAA